MRVPCARSASSDARAPARPEPLYPQTGFPGAWIMAKQSPPMPVMCGSTTHSSAAAATAASAALPPARKVSMATRLARGCEVAVMPSQAMTGERPGSWKSRLMAVVELLRYS